MDIPALAFCDIEVSSPKPLRIKPPQTLESLGDHLRKKRLESRLLQKDVAKILQISQNCLTFWENGRAMPQIQFYPLITKFLGYFPFEIDTTTLGGKVKYYRHVNGLSHKKFGKIIGVDASTVGAWENNKRLPHDKIMEEIFKVLNHSPV